MWLNSMNSDQPLHINSNEMSREERELIGLERNADDLQKAIDARERGDAPNDARAKGDEIRAREALIPRIGELRSILAARKPVNSGVPSVQ